MVTKEHIKEFIFQSHRIGNERLQQCSSGNLSWRVDTHKLLISGTGSWLKQLKEENISIIALENGEHIKGAKPSMESRLHLNIFHERSDVAVILHFQSEYATVISCMKNKPKNFNVTAEIPLYCGEEIPIIPYIQPGSRELAQAVTEAMKKHDLVILEKHGQIACGKDFDDVFQKAVFFELASKIIVHAGEGNYLHLTKEEINDLRAYISGKV